MRVMDCVANIKFKKESKEEGITEIHYLLFTVLLDMSAWFHSKGHEFVLTDLVSTLQEDIDLERESDAHRTFRGADVRSKKLTYAEKEEFQLFFNDKYKDIASISRTDLVPRLVVLHGKGANEHFHVALHYRYRRIEK
jgi:hypothetical protein